MPQPVKLTDALIDAAREAAPLAHRSLAAQVEHWAALGRAVEGNLTAEQSATLKLSVREPRPAAHTSPTQSLSVALEAALGSQFSAQAKAALQQSPRPLYGSHPAYPGFLVRRDADGKLTPGHLVDREFIALDVPLE